MIGKVRGKQVNWETRGWECKLLLWKALLPIRVQKENTKNPSTAATAREKNTVREGAAERPVRSNRKSFCNCTNGKRKAEKALVCCVEGRNLNR